MLQPSNPRSAFYSKVSWYGQMVVSAVDINAWSFYPGAVPTGRDAAVAFNALLTASSTRGPYLSGWWMCLFRHPEQGQAKRTLQRIQSSKGNYSNDMRASANPKLAVGKIEGLACPGYSNRCRCPPEAGALSPRGWMTKGSADPWNL